MAVPLAIHLLNRKFPRVIQFPNVENVKKALAQRSKWFRMRHLIMLLLRTLALILLVLVFLKPLAGVFGSGNKVMCALLHVAAHLKSILQPLVAPSNTFIFGNG